MDDPTGERLSRVLLASIGIGSKEDVKKVQEDNFSYK